jgi:hypothetical protein
MAKSGENLRCTFAAAAVCSAALVVAQVAPPSLPPSSSGQRWSVLYNEFGGIAGHTLSLRVDETGLVRFWSRFPSTTLCFSAPHDQVRQLASSVKEISGAQPSKRSPRKESMPDVPSGSLELSYDNKSFSASDYAALPATKRISEIVSQLVGTGRQRARAIDSGNLASSETVPCPDR